MQPIYPIENNFVTDEGESCQTCRKLYRFWLTQRSFFDRSGWDNVISVILCPLPTKFI